MEVMRMMVCRALKRANRKSGERIKAKFQHNDLANLRFRII